MAILLAGTHGLKEAKLHINSEEKPWIFNENSGKTFIRESRDLWWTSIQTTPSNKLQSGGIDHWFESWGRVRLPVDLMFFPTAVQRAFGWRNTLVVENGAYALEKDLYDSYANADQHKFNTDFAEIYSKMLEIGTRPGELSSKWFVDIPRHEDKSTLSCPNRS